MRQRPREQLGRKRGNAFKSLRKNPESTAQIQDTGFPYLQGQIGSRTLAALASSLKCLKNTKMHVFAPFARKRATPRASRSCAVPHRPEAVENAKKAPYPKKNRVVEQCELGWGPGTLKSVTAVTAVTSVTPVSVTSFRFL